MDKLFLTILNMSFTGAFVVAAVCLARLPLKKAPKVISYALWAVAGFRLVFPFSVESVFSLLPFNAAPIPMDIATQAVPRIESGIPLLNNAVSGALPVAAPTDSVNPLRVWTTIGACVWLVGVAVMLVYGVASFVILKRKMRKAPHVETNIFEAADIQSPFVLGVFAPKIYLPFGLSGKERGYVILHEQTHIKRRDHIVKFAAYFILCLHWFNPLAWAAFWLCGADMEMSCDERVLKEMGGDTKKEYSLSLLSLATERRIIGGSPLAFGEGGVKGRIKNVLNFRKPSRVIIVAAVALVAVLSVGFAVNRASGTQPFKNLKAEEITSVNLMCIPPDVSMNFTDDATIEKIVAALRNVIVYNKDDTASEYAGQYVQYTLFTTAGDTIIVGEYNPFINIDGQYYRTKYEPCEELNRLGNQLRGNEKSEYQKMLEQAKNIVSERYPSASVESWGEDTISYTNVTKGIEVLCFEVFITNEERIKCAVSKDMRMFFIYDNTNGEWNILSDAALNDIGWNLTLDDVRVLAAKGDTLKASDLPNLRPSLLSSLMGGYNPTLYGVEGGYRLLISFNDTMNPDSGIKSTALESIWDNGGSGIDIRYGDVDEFIRTHPSHPASAIEEVQDIIERNLDIITEPSPVSNPYFYIDAHRTEYNEIVFLGNDALQYMFSLFDIGNQHGLRGFIMASACREIMGLDPEFSNAENDTGQKWYDAYKSELSDD